MCLNFESNFAKIVPNESNDTYLQLVQVMASTGINYKPLSEPRSMALCGVIRPQWIIFSVMSFLPIRGLWLKYFVLSFPIDATFTLSNLRIWIQYFVWKIKGYLHANIIPIRWKVCVLCSIENQRSLRFKTSYAFLKRLPRYNMWAPANMGGNRGIFVRHACWCRSEHHVWRGLRSYWKFKYFNSVLGEWHLVSRSHRM